LGCLTGLGAGPGSGWALDLPSVGAGAAPPLYFAGSAKPSRLEPIGTAGPPTSSRAGVVRSIRADASLPPKKKAESRLKPRPA